MKRFLFAALSVVLAFPSARACAEHQTKNVIHKDLNQVLEKSGKKWNMEQVLNDLKMSRYEETASDQNLWKITQVKKGSVFAKAGLKAGDVIEMKPTPSEAATATQSSDEEQTELE